MLLISRRGALEDAPTNDTESRPLIISPLKKRIFLFPMIDGVWRLLQFLTKKMKKNNSWIEILEQTVDLQLLNKVEGGAGDWRIEEEGLESRVRIDER
jgi:hypothetical protein